MNRCCSHYTYRIAFAILLVGFRDAAGGEERQHTSAVSPELLRVDSFSVYCASADGHLVLGC